MTAPRILARIVPLHAPVPALRHGECRLCGSPSARRSVADPSLCCVCRGRLVAWAREAEAASPLGVGLARMEGAWPLGELDEVAREWRGGWR